MKYVVFLAWILLSSCVITVPSIPSPADTCATLVDSALKVTDQLCGATSLNQACYGHNQLEVEPQAGFGPFHFSHAGDKIDVMGLRSLRVSALDPTNGDWGVALMHVQANLPNAVPGQNVTFLILGDVQVKNTVTGIVPEEVTVAALSNVNVREAPDLDSFVSGTLSTGQSVTARGRLADGSWLYIDRPDQNGAGWVYGPSMSNAADIQKLSIVDPDTAFYGPMQAFYLQTGEDDNPQCAEAPENGLIIQTSEGVAQVSLWINEVKIRLGSTAFIQAERNKTMTITMLEGTSHVEAKGVEMSASVGSQLSVPLDQNLAAAAPPSAPVPITNTNIQNLPVKKFRSPNYGSNASAFCDRYLHGYAGTSDQHARRHPYADTDRTCDAYRHNNEYAHPRADCNEYSNDAHLRADEHGNGYSNECAHLRADEHGNGYSDKYARSCADEHGNGYSDKYARSCADEHRDEHVDIHRRAGCHANLDQLASHNGDRRAKSHPSADAHAPKCCAGDIDRGGLRRGMRFRTVLECYCSAGSAQV